MELTIPERKFACIDYPGEVVNIEKAVETLGGMKQLHKAVNDVSLRLKLNFRPDDVYCKPAYGDRKLRQGLIVKIRRKKCRDNEPASVQSELSGEILGIVDAVYTFTSMCDFQYLPMVRESDGQFKSLVDELFVKKVVMKEWMSQPAPLFLQPPTFSRFDQPVPYCYRNNNQSFEFPDNCIGISRSRRPHFTMFFKFNNATVPTGPHEESLKRIAKATIPPWKIALLKEKFELHKIWSSLAIQAEVGPSITREDRKAILPTIAYHCADGPWRSMWVKFGYDMRKDPSSKIYQNLDYRQEKGFSGTGPVSVPAKRSPFIYHLPNTLNKGQGIPPPSVNMRSTLKQSSNVDIDYKNSLESAYIFRPGITPKYRQIFYHLYNIKVPEVQELIHLNDGQETECTEKDGWCLPNTIDKCRAIINSYKNKEVDNSSAIPKLESVEELDEASVRDSRDDEIEKEFEVDDESIIEQNYYECDFDGDDDDGGDDDDDGEEEEEDDDDVEIQGDNDGIENQGNYENLFSNHSSNLQDLLDQDKFDKIMKLVPSDDE